MATTAAASAIPAKAYDCGGKGQPLCPLQGWMKTVLVPALSSDDAKKVAEALTTLAAKPPADMPKWSEFASAGAAKAKSGDLESAKDSCSNCHDAYKDLYKRTMRDRAL